MQVILIIVLQALLRSTFPYSSSKPQNNRGVSILSLRWEKRDTGWRNSFLKVLLWFLMAEMEFLVKSHSLILGGYLSDWKDVCQKYRTAQRGMPSSSVRALTWWLTHHSSSRASDASFWPLGAVHTHGADPFTQANEPQLQSKKLREKWATPEQNWKQNTRVHFRVSSF